MMAAGGITRPSRWRHPIRRFRWCRRHGSAESIITVTINGNSAPFVRSMRELDRAMQEPGRR